MDERKYPWSKEIYFLMTICQKKQHKHQKEKIVKIDVIFALETQLCQGDFEDECEVFAIKSLFYL